jgi:hypothetical protein
MTEGVYYTMLRITFMLMSLAAVVGASALASASASAIGRVGACETVSVAGSGQWNNAECTEPGGSKEWSTKEVTSGELKATGGVATLKGEIAKAEAIITCAKSKTLGEIEAAGAAKGETVFEECEVGNSKEKFVNCEVPNIKVKFKSQLTEEEGELRDEFKPQTGTEFTTIKINNKGENVCIVKGTFKVEGFAIALVPNADVFKYLHLFDFSLADNSTHLTLGGKTASFTTSISVYLLRGIAPRSRFVVWDLLR